MFTTLNALERSMSTSLDFKEIGTSDDADDETRQAKVLCI